MPRAATTASTTQLRTPPAFELENIMGRQVARARNPEPFACTFAISVPISVPISFPSQTQQPGTAMFRSQPSRPRANQTNGIAGPMELRPGADAYQYSTSNVKTGHAPE